jgi:hypothetical protein
VSVTQSLPWLIFNTQMFRHSDKQGPHITDPFFLSVDLVPMTLDLVLMSEDQVLLTVDLAHLPKNPNPLYVREIRTTSVEFTKKFHAVLLDNLLHIRLIINRELNPPLFLKIRAQC